MVCQDEFGTGVYFHIIEKTSSFDWVLLMQQFRFIVCMNNNLFCHYVPVPAPLQHKTDVLQVSVSWPNWMEKNGETHFTHAFDSFKMLLSTVCFWTWWFLVCRYPSVCQLEKLLSTALLCSHNVHINSPLILFLERTWNQYIVSPAGGLANT